MAFAMGGGDSRYTVGSDSRLERDSLYRKLDVAREGFDLVPGPEPFGTALSLSRAVSLLFVFDDVARS